MKSRRDSTSGPGSARKFAQTLTAAVGAIAGVVEVGDPYTFGHQGRVSTLACDIARAMGWSEDELRGMQMAAMVHDIGKLAAAGKLDAEVVAACTRLFREQGYELPRAAEQEYRHAEMLADLAKRENR